MQQEEVTQQEEEEVLQNLGQLIIFKQVRETQQNYGLQHGDYTRYRKYCSNKVKKLRDQMKFKFGKRFQKKQIQEEIKNDPRVLHVFLYRAEKNWAHAMSLKQLINSGINKKINKRRTKVYLVKKLKKSIKHASQLQQICEQRTENRTSLEAEAYHSYLTGLYYFESEQWSKAIDQLLRCYNIYEQINKVCDQFNSGLYQEKLDAINQQIRYCNAKTKRTALLSMDDLLKMQQHNIDPTLSAKLEEMLEEQRNAKLEQQQGQFEIEYQDSKYPIKSEKVIKIINKIYETREIDDLDQFIQLFSFYDEAIKLTKQDKENSTSTQEKEIHNKIISFLNYQRQCSVLDRNELLIKQFTYKFIKEDGINNLQNMQTKKAQKLKLTTPQEIIKYCDNYQQTLRIIMDEERFSKDITLFKKLDAKEYFAKGLRCFFVGCLSFMNDKFRESYSLLGYSIDLIKIANRKYEENKLQLLQLLQDIIPLIKQVQSKSKLYGLKQSQEQIKQVGQDITEMTIEEDQKQFTLFELLDKPENITLHNVLQYKPADLSTQLQPIPPKPIQLDIALSYLEYPKLEEQKKGFWGKINIFKKS